MNAFQVDLPKFELLEEVGHGGMATVYRARDKRLNREVAVKVIHRHLRENPEVARRFASEALAVAKLKHPNIVEVYDVSSDEETERYLVVELVRGGTLRKLILENGSLPPELAASICIEVLRALSVAHRHGVIHRDIKPENVLVHLEHSEEEPRSTKEARVRIKLTDFGIAKLLDAQGVTHTGQVLGSPAHMAPEQIEGGDVDARADIFGVGVLFYEMLTGSLPFEGKNPAQVLRRVLEGSFTPPDRMVPTVGAVYSRIVCKALAQQPSERFATATEFADELERELAQVNVENPRAEVDRYFEDPRAYQETHADEIVPRLSQLGHSARKHGDILGSIAAFNRALAYRPDDTMLLAAVSGIRQRGRIRKLATIGALVCALAVMVTASALLGRWYMSRAIATKVEKKSVPASSERSAPVASPQSSVAPEEPVAELPKAGRARRTSGGRTVSVPAATPAGSGVRSVRTPVIGPQNARVRIDGKLYPWFNAHELSIGTHTFEFLPPNEDCCEVPAAAQVQVVPGDGAQVVRGVIRFRPATLELSGQRGGRASCGVAGSVDANTPRVVPMNQAELRLSCTVFAPPASTEQPKTTAVVLRPGQKVAIQGF